MISHKSSNYQKLQFNRDVKEYMLSIWFENSIQKNEYEDVHLVHTKYQINFRRTKFPCLIYEVTT